MAGSQAAPASSSQAGRLASSSRSGIHHVQLARVASPSRIRAARRVLLVVVVLEVAVLAVWALDSVGFDPRVAAGAVAVFTGDVLAGWLFVARNNRGMRQR